MKTSSLPARHGRDHVARWDPDSGWRGGYDPTPVDVFLAPSGLMGNVLSGQHIAALSLGVNSGVLYLPEREGAQLATGEALRASLSFAEPSPAHFDWLGMRVHAVDGLLADTYRHSDPWESDPWFGGVGAGGTGASLVVVPVGGNWNGYFYGIAAVSASAGDVVHFSTPGLEIDEDEQFGWDVPGVGHIGYMFHDFTTSEAGNLTATFADGAGPAKVLTYVRCRRAAGSVTVGSMLGETTVTGTAIVDVTLTGDVPAGSGLIVVTASQGPAGFDPSDATRRPVVENKSRRPAGNLIPVFKVGSQLYPIPRDIGGLGQSGTP